MKPQFKAYDFMKSNCIKDCIKEILRSHLEINLAGKS